MASDLRWPHQLMLLLEFSVLSWKEAFQLCEIPLSRKLLSGSHIAHISFPMLISAYLFLFFHSIYFGFYTLLDSMKLNCAFFFL